MPWYDCPKLEKGNEAKKRNKDMSAGSITESGGKQVGRTHSNKPESWKTKCSNTFVPTAIMFEATTTTATKRRKPFCPHTRSRYFPDMMSVASEKMNCC